MVCYGIPIYYINEYDDRIIDGVQVSVFTRDVNRSSSTSSNKAQADDIEVEEEEEPKAEHLRHWALVFYFPNSSRYNTYEAFNRDEKLGWTCTQMPPNKVKGYKLYKNIATCRTSPKQLQEWAKSISINDLPYNAGFRNCQEWIMLFSKLIGGEVNEYIQKHWKSLYGKNTFAAAAVGTFKAVLSIIERLIGSYAGIPLTLMSTVIKRGSS